MINILHLSDIHLGTISQANRYRTTLEADLKRELNITQLDYLVISGDVANNSSPEEYAAAAEFVNGLVSRFGLNSNKIIIVPGNHDLDWSKSKEAYSFVYKSDLGSVGIPQDQKDLYIYVGDLGFLKRNDEKYKERFTNFNEYFFKKLYLGCAYPQDYSEQCKLYINDDDKILFLALNSSWEIDHYYRHRAGIHSDSICNALDQIVESTYDDWLKIAVWHHPVTGCEAIKADFLQQLVVHGFKVCMHGHIHEAHEGYYKYGPNRGIHIIGAGTFGAPSNEQVTGIPLQYNILHLNLEDKSIIVETRKKERPDGVWTADARWGNPNHPEPSYTINLG